MAASQCARIGGDHGDAVAGLVFKVRRGFEGDHARGRDDVKQPRVRAGQAVAARVANVHVAGLRGVDHCTDGRVFCHGAGSAAGDDRRVVDRSHHNRRANAKRGGIVVAACVRDLRQSEHTVARCRVVNVGVLILDAGNQGGRTGGRYTRYFAQGDGGCAVGHAPHVDAHAIGRAGEIVASSQLNGAAIDGQLLVCPIGQTRDREAQAVDQLPRVHRTDRCPTEHRYRCSSAFGKGAVGRRGRQRGRFVHVGDVDGEDLALAQAAIGAGHRDVVAGLGLKVGTAAPEHQLALHDGKAVCIGAAQGEPVVVATGVWVGDCEGADLHARAHGDVFCNGVGRQANGGGHFVHVSHRHHNRLTGGVAVSIGGDQRVVVDVVAPSIDGALKVVRHHAHHATAGVDREQGTVCAAQAVGDRANGRAGQARGGRGVGGVFCHAAVT